MFTFTDPSSREEDRRAVQDTLIPFVSANRAGPSTPAVASPAPAGSTPGTATGAAIALKGKRKAKHVSPEVSGASGGKVEGPASYKARLRVLSKNPNLKILYRELVVGKQITEEEFWEGREASIRTRFPLSGLAAHTPPELMSSRLCSKPKRWPTHNAPGALPAF